MRRIFTSPFLFRFVWRQLEFAFFGATTSVVALFDFLKHFQKEKENEKDCTIFVCCDFSHLYVCLNFMR